MTSTVSELQRPPTVVWAVALMLINAVGGLLFAVAWPDLDERGTIVVVSSVFAALFVAAAWFLWNGSRRGAIASVIVNILNILLGIPGFFQDFDAGIVATLIAAIALSALTIALLFSPAARGFWGVREGVAAS